MAKYTEGQKSEVVALYVNLMKEGYVAFEVDSELIEAQDVRGLCLGLDISSYSLYKWVDERGIKTKQKPKQEWTEAKISRAQKEALIPDLEFDNYDEWGWDEGLVKDELIIRSEQRFVGFLASVFGIKNYGSLPKNQVYLKLGLALIKRSGLVKTIGDK